MIKFFNVHLIYIAATRLEHACGNMYSFRLNFYELADQHVNLKKVQVVPSSDKRRVVIYKLNIKLYYTSTNIPKYVIFFMQHFTTSPMLNLACTEK